MRLMLSADWHFDTYPNLSAIREDGRPSRLQDIADAWAWMLERAKESECNYLLVAGDMFNSRTQIAVEVLDTVGQCMAEATRTFRMVYLLAGNHDAFLRGTSVLSTRVLQAPNLRIVDKPRVLFPAAPETLCLLPWNDDEEELRKGARQLAKATQKAGGARPWLVSHLLLRDIYPDAGVPLDVLGDDLDYWSGIILGDEHAPRKMAGSVQYLGAPLPLDFGDGAERGVWTLIDGALTFIQNDVSPRFFTVRGGGKIPDEVRGVDFVRILDVDPDAVEEVSAAAKEKGCRLRVESVKVKDVVAPRMNVGVGDRDELLVEKYLSYRLKDDPRRDDYAAAGVQFLQAARGAVC
jgi:DNA repair exonuclease SbcCD nuclease subunit